MKSLIASTVALILSAIGRILKDIIEEYTPFKSQSSQRTSKIYFYCELYTRMLQTSCRKTWF